MTGLHNVPLALVYLFLTGVTFYFGFVHRDPSSWMGSRRHIQGAFIVSLFLCMASGYVVWRETQALREIRAYVSPYPSITDSVYVPTLSGSITRTWMCRTRDPKEAVYAFYRDAQHRVGWSLITDAPMIVLRKGERSFAVVVREPSETHDSGESTIMYTLYTTK